MEYSYISSISNTKEEKDFSSSPQNLPGEDFIGEGDCSISRTKGARGFEHKAIIGEAKHARRCQDLNLT
jgi:hypothetical protein